MLKTEQPIEEATRTKRRVGADCYEVVIQDDGGYRIAFNGSVIGCFYWKHDELDQCLRALDSLANRDSHRNF